MYTELNKLYNIYVFVQYKENFPSVMSHTPAFSSRNIWYFICYSEPNRFELKVNIKRILHEENKTGVKDNKYKIEYIHR